MSVTSTTLFAELHPWISRLREPLVRDYEFLVEAQKSAERVLTGYYGSELTKHIHGAAICGTVDYPKLCVWVPNDEEELAYNQELVYSVTGLSIDEVDVIPTKPFTTLLATPNQVMCGWRNNRYRPVAVGCGVMGRDSNGNYLYGQPAGCSLGFIAVDRSGNIGFVSANHCFAGTLCGVGPGYYVVQPDDVCGGSYPSDVIAYPVYTKDYGSGLWLIDAAFSPARVSLAYSYLSDQKVIPFPGVRRTTAPQLGLSIIKFGRGVYTYSTRSTTISSINGTIQVGCSLFGPFHTFYPVFGFSDTISPGDSGSGSYVQSSLAPIGLNFAGNSTLGFDIYATEIEKELGITLLTAPPSAIPVPSTLLLAALIGAGVVTGVGIALAAPTPS